MRLAKAANAEERLRQTGSKVKTRAQHELELKLIIQEIRKVLGRIEDAVPLINLAITTSGASLSTSLPATVSPSRLLQASTFLTAGDTQFSMQPGPAVQIGPTFTLSMYMLFSGHAYRLQDEEGNVRDTTWKEVIHKAKVKLRRVPLEMAHDLPQAPLRQGPSIGDSNAPSNQEAFHGDSEHSSSPPVLAGEGAADEFAYQLLIIEDFDDERVHSFEDDEPKPGPYDDVELAGIREVIPIHEVSKIFYADTGKILNIGNEGEPNSPVLLLKRDVNAIPPRRMMERFHRDPTWHEEESYFQEDARDSTKDEDQSDVDAQLSYEHRSSSVPVDEPGAAHAADRPDAWHLPANLDPEWIAFEVYTEQPESDDDEPVSESEDPKLRPVSSRSRESSLDPALTNGLSALHLSTTPHSSPEPSRLTQTNKQQQIIKSSPLPLLARSNLGSAGPIRTSLSLLEVLIRLTALQQFQQTSHLSIPDELLNFFLSESSTTGAGADGEERRRKRWEARQKVGFDPYDESPVKRRGESGIADGGQQQLHQEPYSESEAWDDGVRSPQWQNSQAEDRRASQSPSSMLLRARQSVERATPSPPRRTDKYRSSLPGTNRVSSLTPASQKSRPSGLRSETESRREKMPSPLGRSVTAPPDSTLGTSPGYESVRGHEKVVESIE